MSRILVLVAMFVVALPATAQVVLTEVGAQRGIEPSFMEHGKGGSVIAADYDNDGDIDLFVPNAGGVAHQLYNNRGDGQFDEIAVLVGLASMDRARIALWFDYDGDHRMDLFTAGDCFETVASCPETSTLHLYRQQENGFFVETTLAAGLTDDLITTTTQHRGGVSAGDVNNDGYLDLQFGLWQGEARLFLNNGNGTFSDVSEASGIGQHGFHWQPLMYDFNGDGWLDIYATTDFSGNHLWINQSAAVGGTPSFVDIAPAANADNAWNDMGISAGDYDGDGDFDLYITNITSGGRNNVLYRNDTVGDVVAFTRVSHEAGVALSGWDWGTTFVDIDNDGDVDLGTTNGWFSGPNHADRSNFFRNDGGSPVTFSNVSEEIGFNDTLWGSALLGLDYDRDGDLDLVQSANGSGTQVHQIRILENEPGAEAAMNHYLVVRPRMQGPNHWAIGAVVRIEIAGQQQMRLISAGVSAFGQEPAEAFFGLGEATVVDRVIVDWPDGTRTERGATAADQVITLVNSVVFADGFESGNTSAWSMTVSP